MKDQSESLNELCFELYTKGLTTRDIESITQSIYGTVCNVESVLTLLSKVAIDMNSSTYRHPVSRLIKSDLFNWWDETEELTRGRHTYWDGTQECFLNLLEASYANI